MATRQKRVPSLAGKGSISIKTADIDASMIAADMPVLMLPNQSNVYSNTIGSIWLVQQGNYGNRNPGTGYLWDIPSGATGFYANRV